MIHSLGLETQEAVQKTLEAIKMYGQGNVHSLQYPPVQFAESLQVMNVQLSVHDLATIIDACGENGEPLETLFLCGVKLTGDVSVVLEAIRRQGQHLSTICLWGFRGPVCDSTLANLPQLKRLTFGSLQWQIAVPLLQKGSPTLKNLDLYGCFPVQEENAAALFNACGRCATLEELHCDEIPSDVKTTKAVAFMIYTNHTLTALEIEFSDTVQLVDIAKAIGRNRTLLKLFINHKQTITNLDRAFYKEEALELSKALIQNNKSVLEQFCRKPWYGTTGKTHLPIENDIVDFALDLNRRGRQRIFDDRKEWALFFRKKILEKFFSKTLEGPENDYFIAIVYEFLRMTPGMWAAVTVGAPDAGLGKAKAGNRKRSHLEMESGQSE